MLVVLDVPLNTCQRQPAIMEEFEQQLTPATGGQFPAGGGGGGGGGHDGGAGAGGGAGGAFSTVSVLVSVLGAAGSHFSVTVMIDGGGLAGGGELAGGCCVTCVTCPSITVTVVPGASIVLASLMTVTVPTTLTVGAVCSVVVTVMIDGGGGTVEVTSVVAGGGAAGGSVVDPHLLAASLPGALISCGQPAAQ